MEHNARSSDGWSGCVVGGHLYGHQVALKFAPCKSERAKVSQSHVLWKPFQVDFYLL
jgi:hypothetical protein